MLGQSVDAAGLGFEFADAIHHTTFEVLDNRRGRGVGFFEPRERAAKMSWRGGMGCLMGARNFIWVNKS